MAITPWITALRLRTLPLALSSIGMGAFLAAANRTFRWDVFLMCALTTVLLQMLSNLANDYGDFVHGVDHAGRSGPARAVQSGSISVGSMRAAVILLALLSLVSGVLLLLTSLGSRRMALLAFFALGLLCIAAAVMYTIGRKPYGYVGLGDLSVFLFFGVVGVMGSHYLYSASFQWMHVLPAATCGVFSVAVLNINNVRDIESDREAGKRSIPVRIGRERALAYHFVLLSTGWAAATAYCLFMYHSPWQFLYLLSGPLFIRGARAVRRTPATGLDPWLRQLALSTLAFVLLFGLGQVI